MATGMVRDALKQVGKGLGSIVLAMGSAVFAAYAQKHFSGWGFALALLLIVFASIPMVLFFNLFTGKSESVSSYKFQKHDDEWDDLFSPWHRDDDDSRYD